MARFGVTGSLQSIVGSAFPWGTLAVNLVGSFGLGLAVRLLQASVVAPETRALLTAGFFGSFTTFSAYSYEAVTLMQGGEWARAIGYLAGSVAAGLVAIVAGLWLGAVLLQGRG